MGIRDDMVRHSGKGRAGVHGREARGRKASASEGAAELARYKFLLRVAPRERLEQAHQAAFAELGPEGRERLFLKLFHDLPKEDRPISSEPAELAHAAVVAEEADHGYLVRILRRPRQGVTEGHSVPSQSRGSGNSLFADSMLAPVAAGVVGSKAVTSLLRGFATSLEAAQMDPSVFARPPGPIGHAAWEAGMGGGSAG